MVQVAAERRSAPELAEIRLALYAVARRLADAAP